LEVFFVDERLGTEGKAPVTPRGGGKLSVRFRRVNTLLFAVASVIIITVMAILFNDVIVHTSSEYAGRYAFSAAEALSAHINRELGFVSMVARSDIVIEWMLNEDDDEIKTRAFEEMRGVLSELYGYNLYVGLEGSRHQYRVEAGARMGDITPVERLDASNPDDAWFFDCIAAAGNYTLNIDIDDMLHRKRVWLNYKVIHDG
jgi:hypothetical protein